MILISHRGNIIGPNIEQENSPNYILEASIKYDIEIDVWLMGSQFYLGHDKPQYKIELDFLKNKKFWCHAKNLPALTEMLKNNIHCFWHQTDDVILTSQKYIWTYPGKEIAIENAIAVMPEKIKKWDISKAYGICSDYIKNYL